MKAVVFVDRFFTRGVFEKATRGIPFWEDVHCAFFDVGWPRVPLSSNGELKEFVPYPEEALSEVEDAEILITQMGLVDEKLLSRASALRIVGCLRSGPVNVDQEALARRGIPLLSVPERSVEAVAEFTIGLFIAARRGIVRACREARAGIWNQDVYFTYELAPLPLTETVVGLIGFGRIARRVAELLRPFQVREIFAYDPYVDEEVMTQYGVVRTTLENLLVHSDVVSLHVRYTGANRRMLGEREFCLMKPGAIFINTARGELVDEEALCKGLKRGQPAFACIDTCCREPWEGCHPLAGFDNVLLTPHIAGASRSTVEIGAREIARRIAAYFESNGAACNPEPEEVT